jgi:hypothetical protein
MAEKRVVPAGFVKTSFEISVAAKYALEDLRTALRRDEAISGVSEAAIIETLILSAAREGVDTDVLAKVITARRKAQDAPKAPASVITRPKTKGHARGKRTGK